MTEKRVAVKFQAIGADQMKAEFTEIGREGVRAFDGIRNSSARMGPQIQNAAFQVGDFFVQVSSGTSATRALAQQLPQLLGGFGLFGALAGAGVAALAALIPSLISTGDEAESLADQTEKLSKATADYQKLAKEAAAPIAELKLVYGELADEVRRAREEQAALARSEAVATQTNQAQDIASQIIGVGGDAFGGGALAGLEVGLDGLIAKRDELARKLAELPKDASALDQARPLVKAIGETEIAIAKYKDLQVALFAVADAYGLSADQARELVLSAGQVATAGEGELATAASEFAAELLDAFGSSEAIKEAFGDAYPALLALVEQSADLQANLAGGASEAERIAKAQAALSQMAIEFSPGGQALLKYGSRAPGGTSEQNALAKDNEPKPVRKSRGGGGGIDPGLAEAQRLYEATRTSAEKYAQEVERINELHRLFPEVVTQEVVDRGLKALQEELGRTDNAAQQASSAIRNAFTGLFDDPKEALRQLGEQLFQMAVFKQLATSLPGVFGAGGLIPLTSFDGGGYTGTGTRSGGLDGKGGFLAMMHPNEQVTDLNRGGAGGTSVVVQNYSGAPARAERSQGPNGQEMIRVVVGEQMARGGYDKSMQGRYGTRPNPVKR